MSLITPSPVEKAERIVLVGNEFVLEYQSGRRPAKSQGHAIQTASGNRYNVTTFEEGENHLRVVLAQPATPMKWIALADLDEIINDLVGGGLA